MNYHEMFACCKALRRKLPRLEDFGVKRLDCSDSLCHMSLDRAGSDISPQLKQIVLSRHSELICNSNLNELSSGELDLTYRFSFFFKLCLVNS